MNGAQTTSSSIFLLLSFPPLVSSFPSSTPLSPCLYFSLLMGLKCLPLSIALFSSSPPPYPPSFPSHLLPPYPPSLPSHLLPPYPPSLPPHLLPLILSLPSHLLPHLSSFSSLLEWELISKLILLYQTGFVSTNLANHCLALPFEFWSRRGSEEYDQLKVGPPAMM